MVFFVRTWTTTYPPIYLNHDANPNQAIGAAQDAARMERVVGFYAGLPRGAAPQVKPTGILGRYQARFFNKGSGARK